MIRVQTILFFGCALLSFSSLAQLDEEIERFKNDTLYSSEHTFQWIDEILFSSELQTSFAESFSTGPNRHKPKVLDTFFVYTSEFSNINVLGTESKRILLDCEIMDTTFTFSERITIGSSKETVENVLAIEGIKDTLVVIEEYGYGVSFTLYFEEDKLVKLLFNSFID